MSRICRRLHEVLCNAPEMRWPFEFDDLPSNGIYFFYEDGEVWGHGGDDQRIVRVGTHREGNFRSRMADHYIVNERKMDFDKNKAAPKDRSIFRKNLGRALLHRDHDPYEVIWNIDFTTRAFREEHGHRRDIEKERQLERDITQLLREQFTFRWIELEGQDRRMGSKGLEAGLIGTLARCDECDPSKNWLGRLSPKAKIVSSGLWLLQHLGAPELDEDSIKEIEDLVSEQRSDPL